MDFAGKIIKQTSWQLLGKVISSSSTLITLIFITRTYGAEGTGIYTLALTYLAFFFLTADLGLNAYILPRLPKNPNEISLLLSGRLIWSVFLVIAANSLVYFFPFKTDLFIKSVFFGSVSIIFSGVFNSANLIFQNSLKYEKSILAQSFGSITSLLLIIILSLKNVSIEILAIGPMLGWAVNSIAAAIFSGIYKFNFKLPGIFFTKNLISNAWPISLSLILNVVYFRVDSFILSSYYTFKEVGIYNLAYQIFSNILVLPTFIMNSFYPLMIRDLAENRLLFKKRITYGIKILLALSVVLSFVLWLFSPLLIELISGNSFTGSIQSLKILSFGIPAYFLSALLMWVLITLKKYKIVSLIYTVGLLFNLFLNLIFIPKFSYIGASVVTGASEYLILILQVFILWKEFKK